jgi:RNA polymerase sigma factor (sigma-70 family)
MHPVSRPDTELDRWFVAEILPHEAALIRYLRRIWSNPRDLLDLRQDIYVKLYEAAATRRPHAPKAFLFTIARNLMTDRIRHGRIISIDYTQDLDELNVIVDELSPERRIGGRQDLKRLIDALDGLPERSRQAIWLRRIEGLTQRQAAEQLGLLEKTLAGYLSRGLRELAQRFFSEPVTGFDDSSSDSAKTEHGKPL